MNFNENDRVELTEDYTTITGRSIKNSTLGFVCRSDRWYTDIQIVVSNFPGDDSFVIAKVPTNLLKLL